MDASIHISIFRLLASMEPVKTMQCSAFSVSIWQTFHLICRLGGVRGVGVVVLQRGYMMEFVDMESGRWYQAPIDAVIKTTKKHQVHVIHGLSSLAYSF